MEEKQVKQITLGGSLGWIFGVILLLAGLIYIFSGDILPAILMMLMGFILLPPSNTLLAKKFGFTLSKGMKIVLIIILFILVGVFAEDKTKEEGENSTNDTEITEDTGEATDEEVSEDVAEETPTEEADDTTLGEKNALKSALSYLSVSSFSYTGLIKQLEYEGYTKEEATYAVDNCGADWNEQAAETAKSYMDTSSFSRTELINQLKYEGFTQEQAEYGAEAVGY